MGGKGPAPEPTASKIARGNPGRRKLNENEPKPQAKLPPCPRHLSDEAKKEFRRMGKHLLKCGLMTLIDGPAFSMYCQSYGRWVWAEQEIAARMARGEELIYVTMQGKESVCALLEIAGKSMEQCQKFLVQFGMTPSARSNVKVAPPEDEEKTAWELYRERKTQGRAVA